jgi:methionine-S-sulfoxide reductase
MKRALIVSSLIILTGVLTMTTIRGNNREDVQKSSPGLEKATFAGGCFWCMQPPYDKLKGVVSTKVGYTGGHKKDPTYEEVSSGTTGHAEAVEVMYDPKLTRYDELLDIFWHNIDPTTLNKQFADNGTQYRTAVFYHNEEQKRLALASKEALDKSGKFPKPIVTEIVPASEFYPAKDTTKSTMRKVPISYNLYRLAPAGVIY